MTEIEKKAEERANNFLIDLCAYCRECDNKECSHTKDVIFGYKEGYKKGYEQGQKNFDKKVTKLLNSYGVTFIDTNSIGGLIALHQLTLDLEKENEELKNQIAGLQNNIDGQKARKNHHIKENAKLTSECAKLKAQIEKMKNCQNCKYYDATGLDNIQCSECFNGIDKWELAE